MTLNQLFWKLATEKCHPSWGFFGRSCKNIYSLATYHPMNPDTDVTYQTVNLFGSDKCFIYFIFDGLQYLWWNQHNTLSIQFWSRQMYSIHVEQWYVNTLESHFCYFLWRQKMLFTHLAKTFKWTYQVNLLLKNECNTTSPATQFCR